MSASATSYSLLLLLICLSSRKSNSTFLALSYRSVLPLPIGPGKSPRSEGIRQRRCSLPNFGGHPDRTTQPPNHQPATDRESQPCPTSTANDKLHTTCRRLVLLVDDYTILPNKVLHYNNRRHLPYRNSMSFVSEFLINPVLRQARRFSEASQPTPTPTVPPASTSVSTSTSTLPATPTPIPIPASAASRRDEEEQSSNYALVLTDDDFDDNDSVYTPTAATESQSSRPLTSSTQDTIPPLSTSPTMANERPLDHLGFPISPRRDNLIPEDDGMQVLRSRIHSIQARDAPQDEKARLMHQLLLESYNTSRISTLVPKSGSPEVTFSPSPSSLDPTAPTGPLDSFKFWQAQLNENAQPPPLKYVLSESDKTPSYAPLRRPKTSGINTPSVDAPVVPLAEIHPTLGCQHYERNIKLQCFDCDKWYPCRLCHDSQEDHKLPRFETEHMLCMLCLTPQAVSDVCINCGELAAQYYCSICKLWENRSSKPIYHCYDCGICRRGLGLGKDYVHCKVRQFKP